MTRVAAVIVSLVALVLLVRAFFPRYVEKVDGVRDRWSGDVCVYVLGGGAAECRDGRVLYAVEGRWRVTR